MGKWEKKNRIKDKRTDRVQMDKSVTRLHLIMWSRPSTLCAVCLSHSSGCRATLVMAAVAACCNACALIPAWPQWRGERKVYPHLPGVLDYNLPDKALKELLSRFNTIGFSHRWTFPWIELSCWVFTVWCAFEYIIKWFIIHTIQSKSQPPVVKRVPNTLT